MLFNITYGSGIKLKAVAFHQWMLSFSGDSLNFTFIYFMSLTNNNQIKMTIAANLTFNYTSNNYDFSAHSLLPTYYYNST